VDQFDHAPVVSVPRCGYDGSKDVKARWHQYPPL
jgi:hypothetical protein